VHEKPSDSPAQNNPKSAIRNPQSDSLLARHPWLPFLLPFIVYMAASMFEPSPPKGRPGVAAIHYPIVYTAKLAVTIAAMIYVLPGYRQFPFRISLLAIGVGLVGGVLWIAICNLRLEEYLVDWLGPTYTFLAIRFIGLVLVVPVIEEFFLRGFLMRYMMGPNWWEIPFGQVNRAAIVLGTLFPVLYHPEKLAALVWFSLVTWLMIRTKNIWDCVAAHAITNLMLGIFVVTQGDWRLW
jgi:uncharacterized protein